MPLSFLTTTVMTATTTTTSATTTILSSTMTLTTTATTTTTSTSTTTTTVCSTDLVVCSVRNGYLGTRFNIRYTVPVTYPGYPGDTQYLFGFFFKLWNQWKFCIHVSCTMPAYTWLSLRVTFYRRACLRTTYKSGKLTLPINKFEINFETAIACLC